MGGKNNDTQDPFSLKNVVLEEDRKESQSVIEKQTYTKNPMLNQVLNETLQSGVKDSIDKTVTFGTHNVTFGGGGTLNVEKVVFNLLEKKWIKDGITTNGNFNRNHNHKV